MHVDVTFLISLLFYSKKILRFFLSVIKDYFLTQFDELILKHIFSIMKVVNAATYPISSMANGPIKFCRVIIFGGSFLLVSGLAWPEVVLHPYSVTLILLFKLEFIIIFFFLHILFNINDWPDVNLIKERMPLANAPWNVIRIKRLFSECEVTFSSLVKIFFHFHSNLFQSLIYVISNHSYYILAAKLIIVIKNDFLREWKHSMVLASRILHRL